MGLGEHHHCQVPTPFYIVLLKFGNSCYQPSFLLCPRMFNQKGSSQSPVFNMFNPDQTSMDHDFDINWPFMSHYFPSIWPFFNHSLTIIFHRLFLNHLAKHCKPSFTTISGRLKRFVPCAPLEVRCHVSDVRVLSRCVEPLAHMKYLTHVINVGIGNHPLISTPELFTCILYTLFFVYTCASTVFGYVSM